MTFIYAIQRNTINDSEKIIFLSCDNSLVNKTLQTLQKNEKVEFEKNKLLWQSIWPSIMYETEYSLTEFQLDTILL